MRLLRDLSLRARLTGLIFLTSLCAVTLASVAFLSYDLFKVREDLAIDQETFADVLGRNVTAALTFNDPESGRETLRAVEPLRDLVRATIYDADGKPFAAYERAGGQAGLPTPELAADGHRFTGNHLVAVRSIRLDDKVIGRVVLISDLHAYFTHMGHYLLLALMIVLGAGAMAFLLARRMQNVVSRPIYDLVHATEQVTTEGDYAVRVPGEGRDELGTLSRAFNRMLTEIQARDGQLASQVVELRTEVAERQRAEQELRSSQEQLRQAQKMEAVGQLAGGVAHDFNNLLTAILGYAALAARQVSAHDPLVEPLKEIRTAAERAAGLTRQLLAFSRKQVLETRPLCLRDVVGNMSKMVERLIGEDIRLVTLSDEQLAPVLADSGQVEQVVLNLAVNARDAMPSGGSLTIETRLVQLDAAYAAAHPEVTPGTHVLLAVSDTGKGIPPEVMQHIFEPFFTTKETGKGTGLGLSTVYGIVKQSGGHVAVYSEVGHGTVFKVYLPAAACTAGVAPVAALPAQLPAGGSETILLVEDEEQVRALSRAILEMNGYRVIESTHVGDAILLFETHAAEIDLMLTDVIMPSMNGRELYERLASLKPGLRVLYMSGYTDGAIEQHGVLEAGTAFIQKPFTPDSLAEKVRSVLDRREAA